MPWRRGRGCRAIGGAALVLTLVLTACSGDGSSAPDAASGDRDSRAEAPIPTLAGGVELVEVDPVSVLAGTNLAFGTPLPSEEAAAQSFTASPEVRAATVRRVYESTDGRRLGDVVVLSLDGSEIFDDAVLAAFQEALVAGLAAGDVADLDLGGRRTIAATGEAGAVVAYREGDALVLASSTVDADAVLVATRMIEAWARGERGTGELRTPLVAAPAAAVFVPVPTVAFTPFSPPDVEQPPAAPALEGAVAVEGRYGVVAGERRTAVWAIAVDPAIHPTAESLEPAMAALATARAGGAPASPVELVDRVVHVASAEGGQPSTQVFRHRGVVVLVEGNDPAQVEAVTTAWLTALAPPSSD